MVGLAIVVVVIFQLCLTYLRLWPPPLRHRLEPRCRPRRRAAGAADCPAGIHPVRGAVRAGGVHVPGAFRHDHGGLQGRDLNCRRSRRWWWAASTSSAGQGRCLARCLGAVVIGTLQQSLLRMPQVSQFVQDALLGPVHPAGGRQRCGHFEASAHDLDAWGQIAK